MALGLDGKFDILRSSPHDERPLAGLADRTSATGSPAQELSLPKRWVPSRYTVRASTTDGRLILWNTFSGGLTAFEREAREKVERLLRPGGSEGRREGAIGFLADRGFLVEEGTDEYRRLEYAFGRQHYALDRLQLFLLASEDCNFRCKYCYEDFSRGTMEPWVRRGVKSYLRQRIGGLRQLAIEWVGGEPLYRFAAIEDLAPFALQLAQEHAVRYSSKITTNGYLLTPDVVDQLLAWKIENYQITLDGPPESHNQSRPTRDGRGSFSVIFDNLIAMSRRPDSFGVMLRVNFDRQNCGEIDKFLDLAEKHFRDDPRFRLAFRPVGKWGGPNDPQLDICGADESRELGAQLWDEARRRGLHLSDNIHQARRLGAFVCYASRPYSFVVGATGKLMKCTIELDKNERNVVGQLEESGEIRLDDDKMALWTEPSFERDQQCRKCVMLPACQGISCPLLRWQKEGKPPCPPIKTEFKLEMRRAAADFGPENKRGQDASSTAA